MGGETRIFWKPETDRIERVVLKNARGHAHFEYGEPMLQAPTHIRIFPLEGMTVTERQNFEEFSNEGGLAAWPEVGSRMTSRLVTGEDMVGQWVLVQEEVYRYAVQQAGGLRVRSVLCEYLATEVLWEH